MNWLLVNMEAFERWEKGYTVESAVTMACHKFPEFNNRYFFNRIAAHLCQRLAQHSPMTMA